MKDIKEWEGLYAVTEEGKIWSIRRKKYIKQWFDGQGRYLYVTLSINQNTRHYSVHSLVALAFHKKPKGLQWVNHKDGIKTNNTVSNLEWMTPALNLAHAKKTGLHKGYSKITKETAKEIRKQYSLGVKTMKILGNEFGVNAQTISNAINNRFHY